MSQFITLQVGQCGNQIGSVFWPLVLHEYGVQTKISELNAPNVPETHSRNNTEFSEAFNSFFYVPDNKRDNNVFKNLADLELAKVKARAILIDMEDSVIGKFHQNSLRKLFDHTCSVTSYEGSGNNWAVGYHTHGMTYLNKLEEVIRQTVERCDCLHGFLIMHSLGGGTGSGLGTAVLKLLDDNYSHVDRFVSCVYPANTQDVVTSPYNALLATRKLIEHATCVFPAENYALQNVCNINENRKRINGNHNEPNFSYIPFQDINSIIVDMLLHLTSGSRFQGSLNVDMNELATSLVAFPRLQYIFSSVSPIQTNASQASTTVNQRLQNNVLADAWSRDNQLIKIDPLRADSLVIGAAHIYRGDSSVTDIRRNIERFQNKAKFTTWSKETMKVGVCSNLPVGHSSSLLSLINSTAMSCLFKDIVQQFNRLYKKRAHIHHYLQVEHFSEQDFIESREAVVNVYKQYLEITKQTSREISRLQLK